MNVPEELTTEELINNGGLLNWSIDRTNNAESPSPVSVTVLPSRFSITYRPSGELPTEQNLIDYMAEFLSRYRGELSRSTNRNYDIAVVLKKAKKGEGEGETDFECPICFELTKSESKITLNCEHTFCGQCIQKTLSSRDLEPSCALCRTPMSCLKVQNSETHDLVAPLCNNVV
jgi:hypothetical protein